MHLPAKTKLLWYELEKVLGQGGFGTTYFARDVNLKQSVAIKEFFPFDFASRTHDLKVKAHDDKKEFFAQYRERFLQEAQTLASFSHPNIVKVRTAFKANDTAYMVMDYEQGEVLKPFAKRNKLTEAHIKSIFIPVIEGLEAVHSRNFIHRDIKPDNILIRKDRSPVLLDFGSARTSAAEFTESVTILVSPGYAPIEQFHSDATKQGPWTDIYGLAASMYFCITGHAPPNAQQRFTPGKAYSLQEDPVRPLASLTSSKGYSPAFLHAIDKGLSFYASQRPQSLSEWKKLLLIDDFSAKKVKRTSTANHSNDSSNSGSISSVTGENSIAPRPSNKTSVSSTSQSKQTVVAPQATRQQFLSNNKHARPHLSSTSPRPSVLSNTRAPNTRIPNSTREGLQSHSNSQRVKTYSQSQSKRRKTGEYHSSTQRPSKPNTSSKTKQPSAIYNTEHPSRKHNGRKYFFAFAATFCCIALVFLAIKAAFFVVPKPNTSPAADSANYYQDQADSEVETADQGGIGKDREFTTYTSKADRKQGYDSLSSATTKAWISRYQGNAVSTSDSENSSKTDEESHAEGNVVALDNSVQQPLGTTDDQSAIDGKQQDTETLSPAPEDKVDEETKSTASKDIAPVEQLDIEELNTPKTVEQPKKLPPLTNKDIASKAKQFQTIFQTFHTSALKSYFDVSEKNMVLFKSLSKAYTSAELALVPRGASIDRDSSTGAVAFRIQSLYTSDGMTVKPSERWSTITLKIRKDRYGYIHSQWP